jgi:hypothetical protein
MTSCSLVDHYHLLLLHLQDSLRGRELQIPRSTKLHRITSHKSVIFMKSTLLMFKLPRFGGNCCLHLQGNVEMMETAVSSYVANCIASHPRKENNLHQISLLTMSATFLQYTRLHSLTLLNTVPFTKSTVLLTSQ